MFENPQSKLSQQVNQANLQGKQQDAQTDINQRQQNKPEQPKAQLKASDIPPVSPKLPKPQQQPITDAEGNTRLVPEEEKEGFTAKLKRKLKEKAQAYVINKLTEKMSPGEPSELENHNQPGQTTPKANLGGEAPKPNNPTPNRPSPNVPRANMPQMPKLPSRPQMRAQKPPKPRF